MIELCLAATAIMHFRANRWMSQTALIAKKTKVLKKQARLNIDESD